MFEVTKRTSNQCHVSNQQRNIQQNVSDNKCMGTITFHFCGNSTIGRHALACPPSLKYPLAMGHLIKKITPELTPFLTPELTLELRCESTAEKLRGTKCLGSNTEALAPRARPKAGLGVGCGRGLRSSRVRISVPPKRLGSDGIISYRASALNVYQGFSSRRNPMSDISPIFTLILQGRGNAASIFDPTRLAPPAIRNGAMYLQSKTHFGERR